MMQQPVRTANGRAERHISEEGDDGPTPVGKSRGVGPHQRGSRARRRRERGMAELEVINLFMTN
jgi:hypothetical protein